MLAGRQFPSIAVHPVMGHGTIHSTSRIFRQEALQDLGSWERSVCDGFMFSGSASWFDHCVVSRGPRVQVPATSSGLGL